MDVITAKMAEKAAENFVQQHYSIREIKEVAFKNGVWEVTVLTTSLTDRVKRVMIDAKTGRITNWDSALGVKRTGLE